MINLTRFHQIQNMISARKAVALMKLLRMTHCIWSSKEKENRSVSNSLPFTIALIWNMRSKVPVNVASPIRVPMQFKKYASLI